MAELHFTDDEVGALSFVMNGHYDNVLDTRQQTGDNEYDQSDVDACAVLVFALDDFGGDISIVATVDPLMVAIEIALDTPDAYDELDFDALRAAKAKLEAWRG